MYSFVHSKSRNRLGVDKAEALVYQFGNRIEVIVVSVSVNFGIRRRRTYFILKSRINSTFLQLTFSCGIPTVHHRMVFIILDSRIMNIIA
jgi:hypothetical protein